MVDVGGTILVLMRRMSDSEVDWSLPTSRAEHIKNLFSRRISASETVKHGRR